MQVKTWLAAAEHQLRAKRITSSRLDSELILLHCLETDNAKITGSSATPDSNANPDVSPSGATSNPGDSLPAPLDRTWLALHARDPLPESVINPANRLLKRRRAGVPLAYLLGVKEFYGRPFKVTPAVLIPRPETEDAIDISLQVCYNREIGSFSSQKSTPVPPLETSHSPEETFTNPISILDVGTGSGCIAITLALELKNRPPAGNPPVHITALDLSPSALQIARHNARALGAENITFLQSDLLTHFTSPRPKPETEKEKSFRPTHNSEKSPSPLPNIIVANLPYVDKSWPWLSPELKHEPTTALYAENSGLALIFRLIDQISTRLASENSAHSARLTSKNPTDPTPTFHLILEADPSQHPTIIEYAKNRHLHHHSTKNFILHLDI